MLFSKGIRYMLLATFVFSSMNVCVKYIPHLPAVEIVFFRSLITLLLSFTYLKSRKINLWGNHKGNLILRGLFGSISLILYFTTLQYIPLASAVTIQFMAPIFTAILGIFLVKEYVKPLQWLFFIMAFVGVLIIQGFDTRISFWFLLMGLGASVTSGLAHNFIRKMKSSEHPLVIVFYFPVVTLPVTAVWSLFIWEMPRDIDWIILLAIGILTQIAQVLMTKAIQSEELSKVASLRYISIVYALIYGFFLFGEHYNWMTYTGMGLTLLGVILNIWYKYSVTIRQLKSTEAKMSQD